MTCLSSIFQGGNNIHADGVTAVAQVLKDNLVITTVSLNSYLVSHLCPVCLFYTLIQIFSHS